MTGFIRSCVFCSQMRFQSQCRLSLIWYTVKQQFHFDGIILTRLFTLKPEFLRLNGLMNTQFWKPPAWSTESKCIPNWTPAFQRSTRSSMPSERLRSAQRTAKTAKIQQIITVPISVGNCHRLSTDVTLGRRVAWYKYTLYTCIAIIEQLTTVKTRVPSSSVTVKTTATRGTRKVKYMTDVIEVLLLYWLIEQVTAWTLPF